LPDGWQSMDYREFLTQRRVLMAQVVRDAYYRLKEQGYTPSYPEVSDAKPGVGTAPAVARGETSIADLLAAELLDPGATLRPRRGSLDGTATVLPDGRIACGDEIYASPSGAASA